MSRQDYITEKIGSPQASLMQSKGRRPGPDSAYKTTAPFAQFPQEHKPSSPIGMRKESMRSVGSPDNGFGDLRVIRKKEAPGYIPARGKPISPVQHHAEVPFAVHEGSRAPTAEEKNKELLHHSFGAVPRIRRVDTLEKHEAPFASTEGLEPAGGVKFRRSPLAKTAYGAHLRGSNSPQGPTIERPQTAPASRSSLQVPGARDDNASQISGYSHTSRSTARSSMASPRGAHLDAPFGTDDQSPTPLTSYDNMFVITPKAHKRYMGKGEFTAPTESHKHVMDGFGYIPHRKLINPHFVKTYVGVVPGLSVQEDLERPTTAPARGESLLTARSPSNGYSTRPMWR